MKKITLTFVTFLLILSCEKDSNPVFSGITELDETGIIVGEIDLTDWRFDDVWNGKEESLFNRENFKSTENIDVQDGVIPVPTSASRAFPNPVKSYLDFYVKSLADSIEFVIVSNNYNVVFSGKGIGGNQTWMLSVADRKMFKANTIYRIYYKLYHSNDMDEKGHGDVKIIN